METPPPVPSINPPRWISYLFPPSESDDWTLLLLLLNVQLSLSLFIFKLCHCFVFIALRRQADCFVSEMGRWNHPSCLGFYFILFFFLFPTLFVSLAAVTLGCRSVQCVAADSEARNVYTTGCLQWEKLIYLSIYICIYIYVDICACVCVLPKMLRHV